MNTPFSNGSIRQQDINDRRIAQQRIAEAIARETRRTGILLDLAVEQIEKQPQGLYNVATIWNVIQRDETLYGIQIQADRNVADYPGFLPWLTSQRRRLEESGKARLRKAVFKPNHSYRFKNYIGSKSLLAA